MQLLQMDVDEESQHMTALLSRSTSAAAAANVPLGHTSSGSLGAAASKGSNSTAAGSNLRHASGPDNGRGAAGGFHFQMFGQDVTNSSKQVPSKVGSTEMCYACVGSVCCTADYSLWQGHQYRQVLSLGGRC
jgi:hypothetical protein